MSVDSEIGTALLEMVVNEERIIEYQKIKLLERQPVSVAIFQIALKIVKENRHNISQAKFIPFNVRVDSVIEDVEEILKRFLGNRHTEELICNSELPMYVKGEAFKRNEEFEVVLKILQNKKANWCLHTNPSVGNLIPNEAIVLDVYSFAYLCINNNYIGLIRSEIKVFISQETFDAITEWIEKVTDKNFLTVHLEKGGLVKTDASIAEIVYKPFIGDYK